jgi:hypothetical protein
MPTHENNGFDSSRAENRLRHGLRSKRFGLSLGKPPKSLRHDWQEARTYQRTLEEETAQKYGSVDIHQAGQIMSASIQSLRCRLARKWLSEEGGADGKGLPLADRIALVNLMGNAADARDKVVGKLFEKPGVKDDPWAVLDSPPPASPATTASHDPQPVTADNAPQANVGDSATSGVHPDYASDEGAGT